MDLLNIGSDQSFPVVLDTVVDSSGDEHGDSEANVHHDRDHVVGSASSAASERFLDMDLKKLLRTTKPAHFFIGDEVDPASDVGFDDDSTLFSFHAGASVPELDDSEIEAGSLWTNVPGWSSLCR